MKDVTAPFDEAAEPERTPTRAEIDEVAEAAAAVAGPIFALHGWRWAKRQRRGDEVPSEGRVAIAIRRGVASAATMPPGGWKAFGRFWFWRFNGGVKVFLEVGELDMVDYGDET